MKKEIKEENKVGKYIIYSENDTPNTDLTFDSIEDTIKHINNPDKYELLDGEIVYICKIEKKLTAKTQIVMDSE